MWFAASTCYESAGLVSLPYGELLRTRDPILSMSRRLPVGVVGVISPFNFPLILSIRRRGAGARAGQRRDLEARSPHGRVRRRDARQDLRGGGSSRRALQRAARRRRRRRGARPRAEGGHGVVHGILAGGRAVAAAAADNLKRIHLELGGNNAMIVLEDVDIEKAASVAAWDPSCTRDRSA